MARYPGSNKEADNWLRRYVRTFMIENGFRPKDLNCAGRSKGLWYSLFGREAAEPIPENVYRRAVAGLQYLAACVERGWYGGRNRDGLPIGL